MRPFSRFWLLAALVLATAALLVQNLSYRPDPDWQATAKAAARANPLAPMPESVE